MKWRSLVPGKDRISASSCGWMRRRCVIALWCQYWATHVIFHSWVSYSGPSLLVEVSYWRCIVLGAVSWQRCLAFLIFSSRYPGVEGMGGANALFIKSSGTACFRSLVKVSGPGLKFCTLLHAITTACLIPRYKRRLAVLEVKALFQVHIAKFLKV